jgi:hypothetical protein
LAGGLDDLIDLSWAELMSPSAFGFLADDSKDLRFRDRETHIISDAE